jgi:hypothetical protein
MSEERRLLPPVPNMMTNVPVSLLSAARTTRVGDRVKNAWDVVFCRIENLERRTAERDVLFSRVEKLEQRIAELENQIPPRTP